MAQTIELLKLNVDLLSIDSIVETKSKSKLGKLKYNNQLCKIRLPPLMSKYGISKFTDQNTKVDSYTINLDIDDPAVIKKFEEIEQKIIDLAFPLSGDLINIGFEDDEKDTFARKFKSCIKYNKYDPDHNYPSLRPKVFCKLGDDGKLNFYPLQIYGKNPDLSSDKPLQLFPSPDNKNDPNKVMKPLTKISCVIDASSIWGSALGFGNSLKVTQIGVGSSRERSKSECMIVFTPEDFDVVF